MASQKATLLLTASMFIRYCKDDLEAGEPCSNSDHPQNVGWFSTVGCLQICFTEDRELSARRYSPCAPARRKLTANSMINGELSVSERNFFNKFKLAYQRLTTNVRHLASG